MSKKYIITIKSEYEDSFKGLMILGAKDSNLFVDTLAVEDLEELNSDYINEHYGDLQDTAYQRGLEDGKKATWGLVADASSAEYQKGLDDAWEATRKIALNPDEGGTSPSTFFAIFGSCSMKHVFRNFSASEVIAKLKAYEEKQNAADDIKVGDEVERYVDGKFDSKGIYLNDADEKGDYWNCLFWTGACFVTLGYPKNQFKKTGRHLDIASILEKMKE